MRDIEFVFTTIELKVPNIHSMFQVVNKLHQDSLSMQQF